MHKRLIPILLLDRRRRLVKTESFNKRTYIGDPFNVIRLFNEKEVDELCILDIDASRDGRKPDFTFLSELAGECFMPLSYGGGITSIDDCEKLGRSGIEKFVLGGNASNELLVKHLTTMFGSQALIGCVDVEYKNDTYHCRTTKGSISTRVEDYCKLLEDLGFGEIIIQSIDRDGKRNGYDIDLISRLTPLLNIPLVALGGAGTYFDLAAAFKVGASAAASGSTFCFLGRLRAVLINYPTSNERQFLEY